jgi:hypothetical protein
MKFTITQTAPTGYGSFSVMTKTANEARDVVASMVERGAIDVDVVDADGRYYDLIELERKATDESL